MATVEKVMAPWTDDQVKSLNEFQVSGVFHPFTCLHHSQQDPLVATSDGWICPNDECEYTQDWAHPFMTNWQWKPMLGAQPAT